MSTGRARRACFSYGENYVSWEQIRNLSLQILPRILCLVWGEAVLLKWRDLSFIPFQIYDALFSSWWQGKNANGGQQFCEALPAPETGAVDVEFKPNMTPKEVDVNGGSRALSTPNKVMNNLPRGAHTCVLHRDMACSTLACRVYQGCRQDE